MKNYKERTSDVLDKIERHNKPVDGVVDNGGNTLIVKRNKKIALWTAFAAVCLALIAAFNVVLFLPYPAGGDISAYENSEYYGLISVVNKLTYKQPKYKNNFEKWTDALSSLFSGCGASGRDYDYIDGASAPDKETNGNYIENTNNQVEGVTEGDILKRSDKYGFYLISDSAQHTLKVYELNGEYSDLISSYVIKPDANSSFSYSECEMYLSYDCNTVTVITQSYDRNEKNTYTVVINLDVSDLSDIKETARIHISGSYISSRLKEGTLLVFTNFSVGTNPDFSDKSQFLPAAGKRDNMKSVAAENIIYAENATSANYTVVCSIDESTLDITSDYAFLDFSSEVYVSSDKVFLTRSYNSSSAGGEVSFTRSTEINCLYYADGGLEYANKTVVGGFVLNQYSMDEYDGILRIVTEVNYTVRADGTSENYRGASLYCIDLQSFEVCASYERFAPDGESVYSVRFDGDLAYVCTAERFEYAPANDPVFVIDLSDLDNITGKDTGTIPGYSISLIGFKNDTLLGIGYGETSSRLKIELYRETDDGVESVDSFELRCRFSEQFKSYYIDAENGLIGLGVFNSERQQLEYLLVLFDGYTLSVAEEVFLGNYNDNSTVRSAFADGYIYVFSEYGLNVINWNA